MNATQFTPGPWRVTSGWAYDARGEQRDVLRVVDQQSRADVLQSKNAEANARLIAAAPAMYEAMKLAESELLAWTNSDCFMVVDGDQNEDYSKAIRAVKSALALVEVSQ